MTDPINYVSMKIHAQGKGVVNTNGNLDPRTGKEGRNGTKNHIYAKRRDGMVSISSDCIRSALFETDAPALYKSNYRKSDDHEKLFFEGLSNFAGLMRGYVVADSNVKSASSLFVGDFISDSGDASIDIHTCRYEKNDDGKLESNSFYTKEEVGMVNYESQAVIHIERLQFISLDPFGDDYAIPVKSLISTKLKSSEDVENKYRAALLENIENIARKHGIDGADVSDVGQFKRIGSPINISRRGIMLNQNAIHALVLEMIERLSNLCIIKAKGFMQVSDLAVDFNNSSRVFRDVIQAYDVSESCYREFWEPA